MIGISTFEQKANIMTGMIRLCVVSLKGKDDQLHSIETEATSGFAAAHAGISNWSTFWWYDSEGLIDVRSGGHHWRVRARRVSEWYSQMLRKKAGTGR